MIIGLVIAIALFYFVTRTAKKVTSDDAPKAAPKSVGGKIYGSMTCGYTVKQIDKYPDYTFIDCADGGCPSFVSAFPTTEHPDGSVVVGYK
jgi:hypothetical protein